jgi:plastocyanin
VLLLPLRVIATRDGEAQVGVVVTFTPGFGGGSLTPSVDTTGADGIASTTWTLGTSSGAGAASAAATGVGGAALQFGATVLPGAVTTLTPLSGDVQAQEFSTPFANPLIVSAVDQFGNGVSGVQVDWAITAGTGGLSGASSITAANGRASISVTASNLAGALDVRATTVALPADTIRFGLFVVTDLSIITLSNNFFSPANDTIVHGSAVKWVWNGGPHNIVPGGGPANFLTSPIQDAGATYGPVLFATPGVYSYECSVHLGMSGTITVQ